MVCREWKYLVILCLVLFVDSIRDVRIKLLKERSYYKFWGNNI